MKVVEIRCTNDDVSYFYGTGCLIEENGTILTNKHVVLQDDLTPYSIIEIRFVQQNEFQAASFLDSCENDDMALILINTETTRYECFTLFRNQQVVGMEVFTIANSNGNGLEFHKGMITSTNKMVEIENEVKRYYTSDININPGCSVAPVFNDKGELLGLMTMRYRSSGEIILDSSYYLSIESFLNWKNI